jgi:8-oxo-dGTP diphosphatase
MGMWNALGGHLEDNETPKECAIREIYEESNVKVDNAELISISTWNYDDDEIYVYVSNLSDDFDISSYPIKINEGIIDFKDIDWIIHEKNYGVIADLRVFLKDIKENQKNNYHLVYDESKLVEYIKK